MGLSDAQKKLRMLVVGGSEVAALVGLSRYATPISVFAAKRPDLVPPEEFDSHHMERGRFYEEPTAKWGAYRLKAELRQVGTLRHPTHKHVGCTPDYLATPEGLPEEDWSIKVPGPRAFEEWGEAGTDEVPAYVIVQLQYELLVLSELFGVTQGRVLAPVDGDLRTYPIAADPELQGILVEAVERFWRNHVETGKPPSPDATPYYDDYLKRRFPRDTAAVMPADAEAERWATIYREADAMLERYGAQRQLARQELESRIGDAGGMIGEGWRISWKASKGKPALDVKGLIAECQIPPAVVEKFTRRTPSRPFRLTDSARRRKKGQPLLAGDNHVGSTVAVQSRVDAAGDGDGDDAVEVGADSPGPSR